MATRMAVRRRPRARAVLGSYLVRRSSAGRAHERARELQVALDAAARPRLDQQVADRRGLHGSGDDGQPARVGRELAEQLVPTATTDDVDDRDRPACQVRGLAHGRGKGCRQTIDDAPDQRRSLTRPPVDRSLEELGDPVRHVPRRRAARHRSGRSWGRSAAERRGGRPADRSGRRGRPHVPTFASNSCRSQRPMTLWR